MYLLNTTVGNATRSREMVEAYLGRELGATFNDAGEMSVRETNPNIQKLVMLTRVLEAFPDIVPDVINNRISVRDGLSRLKYIKMDSPRGGMALNARTLDMAREFLPRFLEDGSNHFFDAAGNPTEHRTLNLFDETGVGGNFFSSTRIARRILDRQILENNPDLTSEEVNSRVEQMMEGYDRLVASVQNAEKYLALPEMVSQLMVKGARRDWFVWDAEGNPVSNTYAHEYAKFEDVDGKKKNPRTGKLYSDLSEFEKEAEEWWDEQAAKTNNPKLKEQNQEYGLDEEGNVKFSQSPNKKRGFKMNSPWKNYKKGYYGVK